MPKSDSDDPIAWPWPESPLHQGHRECCQRDVYYSIDKLKALSTVQNYYRIAFALIRGGNDRPSLPLEIVTLICRGAGFLSPYLNKDLSDHLGCHRFMPTIYPIYCFRGKCPPPTINKVLRIRSLQADVLYSIGQVEIIVTVNHERNHVCILSFPRSFN
jgi:hypothetical protein